MAAIALADCTVNKLYINGFKLLKIVTPATADGADTIDVSSEYATGCFAFTSNTTDKQKQANVAYGKTVTLPGTAANEVYTIFCIGD